jgi:hypothetical protein
MGIRLNIAPGGQLGTDVKEAWASVMFGRAMAIRVLIARCCGAAGGYPAATRF